MAALPAGWRILLIRTMSWPRRAPPAPVVSTRRSVPDGLSAASTDLVDVRESPVAGWAITVGSGVLLTLCA
jgi:hypothetical protein